MDYRAVRKLNLRYLFGTKTSLQTDPPGAELWNPSTAETAADGSTRSKAPFVAVFGRPAQRGIQTTIYFDDIAPCPASSDVLSHPGYFTGVCTAKPAPPPLTLPS